MDGSKSIYNNWECKQKTRHHSFINGIPISLIELKNAVDEKATISNAYNQFQTYKKDIPIIFVYNEILVISDGIKTKVGTLTADKDRFMPWRSLDQKDSEVELEVVIKEIFRKDRILDILQNFILFETDGSEIIKKLAEYHQYHAVSKAVDSTIQASLPSGNKRVGVVWHILKAMGKASPWQSMLQN